MDLSDAMMLSGIIHSWKMVEGARLPKLTDVVMGIDPSLRSTGVCVIVGGAYKTFTVAPPEGTRGYKRLVWFYSEFTKLFKLFGPVGVSIEGYSFGSIGHAHAIGELGGILRFALAQHGVTPAIVPPLKLKKFMTGAGNCEDGMLSKEIYKRWLIDLNQNDEVDAAGLAVFTIALRYPGRVRSMLNLTKQQLTALDDVNIDDSAPTNGTKPAKAKK